jgi:hypothetical protein
VNAEPLNPGSSLICYDILFLIGGIYYVVVHIVNEKISLAELVPENK